MDLLPTRSETTPPTKTNIMSATANKLSAIRAWVGVTTFVLSNTDGRRAATK